VLSSAAALEALAVVCAVLAPTHAATSFPAGTSIDTSIIAGVSDRTASNSSTKNHCPLSSRPSAVLVLLTEPTGYEFIGPDPVFDINKNTP